MEFLRSQALKGRGGGTLAWIRRRWEAEGTLETEVQMVSEGSDTRLESFVFVQMKSGFQEAQEKDQCRKRCWRKRGRFPWRYQCLGTGTGGF